MESFATHTHRSDDSEPKSYDNDSRQLELTSGSYMKRARARACANFCSISEN